MAETDQEQSPPAPGRVDRRRLNRIAYWRRIREEAQAKLHELGDDALPPANV